MKNTPAVPMVARKMNFSIPRRVWYEDPPPPPNTDERPLERSCMSMRTMRMSDVITWRIMSMSDVSEIRNKFKIRMFEVQNIYVLVFFFRALNLFRISDLYPRGFATRWSIKLTMLINMVLDRRGISPCIVRGFIRMSRVKRSPAFMAMMSSPSVISMNGERTSLIMGRMKVFIAVRTSAVRTRFMRPPLSVKPSMRRCAAKSAIAFEMT